MPPIDPDMPQTPYVEDETGFKTIVITPDSQQRFAGITRDLVMSNLDDDDIMFIRQTQNIRMLIQNLASLPDIRREIKEKYPGSQYGPFDDVIDAFDSENAILINSKRAKDMRQAELLQTSINRIKKSVRTGEDKAKGLFGGGGNQDEYNQQG